MVALARRAGGEGLMEVKRDSYIGEGERGDYLFRILTHIACNRFSRHPYYLSYTSNSRCKYRSKECAHVINVAVAKKSLGLGTPESHGDERSATGGLCAHAFPDA